jgi:hypothetical protein
VSDSRGILLMPELSHADFADMIGSSRPMVSRLFTEMTEEKLLSHQGKHLVLHGLLGMGKTEKSEKAKSNSTRALMEWSERGGIHRHSIIATEQRGQA